ncbi:17-beta-hydroxysteroid dehydrogenase type 6, partial [Pseudolycoriella hygida]
LFFILFCCFIHFCTELDTIVKILAALQAYIASYCVSIWLIKLLFMCSCLKVKAENKCVLITGCDSGFGNEAAVRCNKYGFKVFATCINPNGEGAKHLMNAAADPKRMIIIELDVTKDKDIESAYETVKNSMSPSETLFGLVNNAGIATATEFEFGADLTECNKVIEVNLMGMIKVTRTFLPLIRRSKGRILNVESVAGLLPIPHAIFYGVSKIGAAGFSDNLRVSMYKFSVTVVSINPWLYRTAITNAKNLMIQYENNFKNSSEEVRKAYGVKFMQQGKLGISATNLATKSDAVPKKILTALTTYEPDPRYIVAPIIFQPVVAALLWMPRESAEVAFQIGSWVFGQDRVYPEN